MARMRAMVVHEPGKGLHLKERDVPEPGRHEVRTRVEAQTIDRRDGAVARSNKGTLEYA